MEICSEALAVALCLSRNLNHATYEPKEKCQKNHRSSSISDMSSHLILPPYTLYPYFHSPPVSPSVPPSSITHYSLEEGITLDAAQVIVERSREVDKSVSHLSLAI